MKYALVVVVVALLTFTFVAASLVEQQTSGILKQLGVSDDEARDNISWSFISGYFSYPHTNSIRSVPVADRARLVQTIGAFAKSYTQSEAFKKKLLENHEAGKPTPPETPKTAAQMKSEQKQDLQESIRSMEATMKSLPADQRQSFKEIIVSLKEQLKSLDDPNNIMFGSEMDEMNNQSHEAAMQSYKTQLADWERSKPTNPNKLVKTWLEKFLAETKDIDFDAKIVSGNYGKKVFANPAYESKPSNWKLCYRAGKETVEAGRALAQQWLSELK